MYQNKVYQQHNSVSMGSPLGPTLANSCLAHVEKKMFETNLDYYSLLYMRYVDDIFAVLKVTILVENFLTSSTLNMKISNSP